MSETGALGEVIRSDSQVLQVECHGLYCAPPFGSFFRCDCPNTGISQYGVVTRVGTEPFDSSRVIQAHRLAPGELEQRKPHLPSLLRTVFDGRVVGYGQGDVRLPVTPPLPARLHCFVYPATPEEVRAITGEPAFLRPLAQATDVPLEDLLVAAIQAAAGAWEPETRAVRLVVWGKYLARLLRGDYLTLEGVLQRLSPLSVPPAATLGAAAAAPAVPAAKVTAPRWEGPLPVAGGGTPAHGAAGNGAPGGALRKRRSPDDDPFEE